MKRALCFRLCCSFILLICSSIPVISAGEFLYQWDALPASPQWTALNGSSYVNGSDITSTIVSNGSSNTWKLVDAGAASQCALKNDELGNVSFTTGATIACNVRCSANSSDSSYNLAITNGNVGGLSLVIRSDQCYMAQFDGTVRGGAYPFTPDTTNYHRYYLSAKNSIADVNSSCIWTAYRDGQPVCTYTGTGTDSGFDGFIVGHAGNSGTGTWYFDWIAVNNGEGASPAQWDPVPIGIPDPPAQPTVVYPAKAVTLTGNTTYVQWISDLHDLYEVEITATDSPTDPVVWTSGQVNSPVNACGAGTLPYGTYYIYVRVHNLGGWSPWSSSGQSFTLVADNPPAPSAPSIAIPEAESSLVVRTPAIQWQGYKHDQYEVHLNTTNAAGDSSIWDSGVVTSSADSCDVPALANGWYYAFVRVHNNNGWSPWSEIGHRFRINYQGKTYKQGWVMLLDDQPYNLELLSKAREYHINHVQLSHDIMMYAHQPINDAARRSRMTELIDVAHANGVSEVVAWTHEIQFADMPPSRFMVGGKVNLNDQAFWDWLYWEYDRFFKTYLPNLDGLVLTLTENWPGEGCDFNDRKTTIHTDPITGVELPRSESIRKGVETIYNACKANNKSLYVRDWTLYGGPDRWIRDAVKACDPEIWFMSKGVGAGDWDCIQEYYDIIGTCTGHPELMELDIIGEYWGKGATPCAAPDYLKDLWNYHLPNIGGMVARVERDNSSAYRGPNRINMYAIDALASCPDVSVDSVYDYWSAHWFGQANGPWVSSALKRTRDITSACNGLPRIYPFSNYVARDYVYRSLFDLDYVGVSLKTSRNFYPSGGLTDYEVLRNPLMTASGSISANPPSTLFGDFSPAYSDQTTVMCEAAVVDGSYGLNPTSFKVEYSTNGGTSWVNYPGFTVTTLGSSVEPYRIRADSIPFGARRAGNNKVRFTATNMAEQTRSKVFTVRGLDNAYVNAGAPLVTDGLSQLALGDGNWTVTTAAGRTCIAPAGAGNNSFYFRPDEGFAYDRNPKTLYLQVDYYGASGFIQPHYDSIWMSDQPMPSVNLSGGTGWRTATWKLEDVNFGHRIESQVDFNLYYGDGSSPVRISAVRLSYGSPAVALDPPSELSAKGVSDSQIDLMWTAMPGATKYQVCRNGSLLAWVTDNGFLDTGLTRNTQYTYTVTSFDAADNTSYESRMAYATTLASPPASPGMITCNKAVGTWQTSSQFQFTAVGGFGASKVGAYQYVWDESPTHWWTGNESTWPSVSEPSGSPWKIWNATISPTDPVSGWVLYDGSTTMRTMSEELLTENGIPTWRFSDQGRIWNSNVKIAAFPNVPINRTTGVTMVVRMKAADSPLGWSDSSLNFGFNLSDCSDLGVIVKPDYVALAGPGAYQAQYVDNGYNYHTYVLTLKNTTPGVNSSNRVELYRDGQLVTSISPGTSGGSEFVGPWFGHWSNFGLGAWAYQWIAYRNDGAFAPAPQSGALTMTASHRGSGYYLHLRSLNTDGLPNGTLNLGPYYYWNGSTPVSPTVADDGAYTTSDSIHAKWSPASASVTSYSYAIGTTSGAQDVVAFTNVGLATEVTRTGLSLTTGRTYYVSVRASVGSSTYTGISDGITVATSRQNISEAKLLADNASVALYGKTVTAIFPDCAYIQEQNGMGIRVITTRPVSVGDVVDLAGTAGGSDGERRIDAGALFAKGSGSIPALSVNSRTLGGSEYARPGYPSGQKATKVYRWMMDDNNKRIRSPYPVDVPGLSNLGMLARTFGRVDWVRGNTFYLNDGAAFDDYFDTQRDGPPGIKVSLPATVTPPAEGTFVTLTGISSCYMNETTICRLLKVRQASDIQTF
jgi:hypothetical protein